MAEITLIERISLAKQKAKEIIKFHCIKAPMDKAMESQLSNHAHFAVWDFMEKFYTIERKVAETKQRFYARQHTSKGNN